MDDLNIQGIEITEARIACDMLVQLNSAEFANIVKMLQAIQDEGQFACVHVHRYASEGKSTFYLKEICAGADFGDSLPDNWEVQT